MRGSSLVEPLLAPEKDRHDREPSEERELGGGVPCIGFCSFLPAVVVNVPVYISPPVQVSPPLLQEHALPSQAVQRGVGTQGSIAHRRKVVREVRERRARRL